MSTRPSPAVGVEVNPHVCPVKLKEVSMDFWFKEKNTDGYQVKWKIREILHTEKTPYQELAVVDTLEWGKALILDGALQVSEKD
ncbi:MAG: hypothetical protein M0P20_09105, partial [Methanocorpusculum sp.]|nr:hypothetical protein [Methanocorpusculum sp.]